MLNFSVLFYEVGKHNNIPDNKFDKQQLQWGIDIEKEHTNDPKIAKNIAKDHLSEFKKYYTHLRKMESEAKSNGESGIETHE